MIIVSKTEVNQEVFFFLLTVSLFLLSFLKSTYFKHTKLLVKGAFFQRYANQFLREENVFTERVNIITFLLIIINLVVIFMKIAHVNSLFQIGFLFLVTSIFFLLKIVFVKIFSKIFMLKGLARVTIFFSFLFDRVCAIFVYPVLVLLCFFIFDIDDVLMLLIGCIFIGFLILKLFFLWKIGSRSFGISGFYIFLYLCALEILPVLLIGKQLQQLI